MKFSPSPPASYIKSFEISHLIHAIFGPIVKNLFPALATLFSPRASAPAILARYLR